MLSSLQTDDFAAAFRDALVDFLKRKGLTQTDLAKHLGLGKAGKARINTYCRKSPSKPPAKPDAEILYLLCVRAGFSFEYRGYRISAATLADVPVKALPDVAQQLAFNFDRQFKLTGEAGAVSVTVKRPSGRIEVSLSIHAAV